ncbi:MAG: hypothetical protein FWH57_12350 [Oscillospiraceae bacterium]|nr:hypothetical protein [Oscillospiraceae bacterium]
MYPALSSETVADIAVATVTGEATLDEVLRQFGGCGQIEQLTMAYTYFHE